MFTLIFLAGQLNPCACGESPHLVHWFGSLAWGRGWCWFTCLCCWGCCSLVPVLGLDFLLPFFFLGGRLVWLCCKTLTWVAPCILEVCHLMCLAVALLDSSFLAICCTLPAGYCARSVLPSLTVLAINSLSVMKNQKMSLVRIAAVSWGYSHNGVCASTALYHLSMLLLPCQKAVNKWNLAQTALDCGLQKSLNLDHMACNVTSSVRRFHELYISSPDLLTIGLLFLHLALSWRIANLQLSIFSHFILHLMNLEWRASSTVQSILGPST